MIQNLQLVMFTRITEACCHLDAQLVVALGRGNSASALPALPGALPVLNLELQGEPLQRANFTITHAGVNTVLELQSCAVPMAAIPIAEA